MCNKTANSDDSVGWLRSLTKKKEKRVCLVVHTFLGLPERTCEQLRDHLHSKHTIADLYTYVWNNIRSHTFCQTCS